VEYAQHIPVKVMAHLLGVPESDGDLFRVWINATLQEGATNQPALMRALEEMTEYFRAPMLERRKSPGTDLISYLVQQKYLDGRHLSDNHVLGSVRLLLVAGVDTTWSAIGAFIWHLARVPEDRRRLVAEPELMPTAIEELLRAYAPVTMALEVVAEREIGGCPFKPGQMVLLSFPAANRDPAMFPDADKVVIDRKQNRHAAFGLGIHRCIGSNLARMELKVAVEELLRRVPAFGLAGTVAWSEGTVRGPRRLPLRFG
jgi:cytochrome P450